MDFSFSEEETLLQNTVQSFLRDNYDFETRNKMINGEQGRDPAVWAQLAELGLLGASLPEELGGLGYGAIATMLIAQELGGALAVEPYIPTAVSCAGLLARHGNAEQKGALEAIIAGQAIWALACDEPKSRFHLNDCASEAKASGKDFVLNGEKSVVLGAPFADRLIVSARTSGKQYDAKGISLFVVDAKAEGVVCKAYPTVDGNRAAEISFNNVKLGADALLGKKDEGLALLEEARDYSIAAHCADAIGAIAQINQLTGEYCKTRKQFDVPLSSFQVLQHQMVDMFTAYEQSVSLTYMLTLRLEEKPAIRAKASATAKAYIGKAGRAVGQAAVQLHGGMGMSEEMSVGHYFKRLTVMDTQWGNVDYHIRRFAELDKS